MENWLFILICFFGVFWAICFIIGIILFVSEWVGHKKLDWAYLFFPLFIPFVLLIAFWLRFIWYPMTRCYYACKEDKGIIKHIRRVRRDRRIEAAYGKGEIRRDELPRCCDGIHEFELKGEILNKDEYALIYIENERSEVLNSFFERHNNVKLSYGFRVLHLPTEVKRLASNDIVKYFVPDTEGVAAKKLPIESSTDLLSELCYPEDAKNLHHGVMLCSRWYSNHGAKYLEGTYYPLKERSDEALLNYLEVIAECIHDYYNRALNSIVKRPPIDAEPTEDFADGQYDWEIRNLVEEVKERVEKLEQYGLSRHLLMSMITEKPKLSRLVITKDLRIILPDYHDMEIKMEPINKAVFLLFLNHPEGIMFKCLPDYRKELAEIYERIKPLGLNGRAVQSIEDVTNPLLNSINEKCARIRGAFISQFDEHLAKNYYITGERGQTKKIALPRELVTWE